MIKNIFWIIASVLLCIATCIRSDDADNLAESLNPSGTLNKCEKLYSNDKLFSSFSFDVLPGYGWDNLQNKPMGPVSRLTYYNCKIMQGDNYLIPDNVNIVQDRKSDVSTQTEIIQHWDDYKSVTSNSVNVNAGFSFKLFSIDGSFSYDNQKSKEEQHASKSSVARIQSRYKYDTFLLRPDSELDSGFKLRLMDIAAHIQNNDTEVAAYLAQMLVRRYGTHQITAVHAGAVFLSEDYFNSNSSKLSAEETTKISASLRAKYSTLFHIDAKFDRTVDTTQLNQYEQSVANTRAKTYGGPLWKYNMSLNEWIDGVKNNLVAIDREGDPLYLFITEDTLPELPSPTINDLVQYVREAVTNYYTFNTYRGCTIRDSPYLDFAANVHDDSCMSPVSNYTLGGIFQTCVVTSGYDSKICAGLDYPNPLTRSKSCPVGYQTIQLITDNFQKDFAHYICQDLCTTTGWWLWKSTRCLKQCSTPYTTTKASLSAYWCADAESSSRNTGLLFGGVYNPRHVNPVTDSKTCPPGFYTLQVGETTSFCLSTYSDDNLKQAIPFAGFFNCRIGNPFLSKQYKRNGTRNCPNGYSVHLAGVEDNCDMHYCSKFTAAGGLHEIHQPPFTNKPTRNPNATNTFYVQGQAGRLWIKDPQTKQWSISTFSNISSDSLNQKHVTAASSGNSRLDDGAKAGIGVSIALLAIAVTVLTIIVVKRKRKTNNRTSVAFANSDQTSVIVE